VVEVKNGFARNYLIPQGFAVVATKSTLKQVEQLKQAAEKHRARELANAQDFANVLHGLALRFERKVGERGRLYGSVTSGDIAESIEQAIELKEELDKRKIVLGEPIKALGSYEVPLHIHPEVRTSVRVEVVGDQGETAADFAEEPAPDEEPLPPEAQPDGEY
jgi:large subunit ribosomal protein L9